MLRDVQPRDSEAPFWYLMLTNFLSMKLTEAQNSPILPHESCWFGVIWSLTTISFGTYFPSSLFHALFHFAALLSAVSTYIPCPPSPVSYRGSGFMHLACAVSCAARGLPPSFHRVLLLWNWLFSWRIKMQQSGLYMDDWRNKYTFYLRARFTAPELRSCLFTESDCVYSGYPDSTVSLFLA